MEPPILTGAGRRPRRDIAPDACLAAREKGAHDPYIDQGLVRKEWEGFKRAINATLDVVAELFEFQLNNELALTMGGLLQPQEFPRADQ